MGSPVVPLSPSEEERPSALMYPETGFDECMLIKKLHYSHANRYVEFHNMIMSRVKFIGGDYLKERWAVLGAGWQGY
jgi:hypothetical protein